jgi:hypothetical protein
MKPPENQKRQRLEPGRRGTRAASASLGPDAQAKIGTQLRAMYDDIVKQGVPDRFTDLLNRLDAAEDKPQD